MYDHHDNTEPQIYGVIAEYDDPDVLLKAAARAYGEGYRKMEAYSPFPVHGLADAIGFHKDWIPLCTMVAGLAGAAGAFGMQYFATVIHYPYSIGGRPDFSWPAYIPITFEGMILCAAFTCGISMLLFNGLPSPYHSVMNAKNFHRASSDRFFLCIEVGDPRYDAEGTRDFLQASDPQPIEVSEVEK